MGALEALVVVPQRAELTPLLGELDRLGHEGTALTAGRLQCVALDTLGMVAAVGGHGKVQMAVQTQHLLERLPSVRLVVCAGAAGRLSEVLTPGDVVVGTCSIEHDYRLRFIRRPAPCHEAHAPTLDRLRRLAGSVGPKFQVHFGAIASGDEDVVERRRADQIREETGALCVAWEGAGAARAAAFSGVAFVEIRAITDGADATAAEDFRANLERALPNLAAVLALGGGAPA